MEKISPKHPSDSELQINTEGVIIEALKEYFKNDGINLNLDKKKKSYKLGNIDDRDIIAQPDVYDIENLIFGEIYVCGDGRLKSGQKNKIGTDILKLLTIEKDVEKYQNKKITKLIILTSYNSKDENTIKKDTDLAISKKLLGPASWKIKAIEMFDFEVLIYFQSEKEKIKLDETRKRQSENQKK